MTLSGCLHTTPTGETSAGALFCDVAKPISYRFTLPAGAVGDDTAQTRAEILSHNAAGCALCMEHPGWAARCLRPAQP